MILRGLDDASRLAKTFLEATYKTILDEAQMHADMARKLGLERQ